MKITGAKNTNTATNGFLLCFRPFPMGDDDNSATINVVDSADLKSFPVIEKPKPKPKSSSKVHSSDKESIDTNQKKTARRRVLSKFVKAMAFQSSLSKKVRNGKITQDPHFRKQNSRRRSSSSSEEDNNSSISSSILSSSSSSLSISSSSSIASSWGTSSSDSSRSLGSLSGRQKSFRSDSIEDVKKQSISTSTQSSTTTTENQKKKKKKKKEISGICLLLISLFVLILWGKCFAIIFTSTWFYFVSTTRGNSDGGDNERQMLIKLPVDTQSKEYKKKIIMEGFLERTRNHRGVFHHHQH